MDNAEQLTDIAHVIQTALTPVFLLSGIGTLLNVFNQRLVRVSDQYAHLNALLKAADAGAAVSLRLHLARLARRRLALDACVALAASGGAATCGAAFALFLVTLRDAEGGVILEWLFGGSLCCTIGALIAFVVDTVLAWHGLHIDGPAPRLTDTGRTA